MEINKPPSKDGPDLPERRRQSLRRKALLQGLAVSRDGTLTTPCTIKNLSETGAKVEFSRGQVLPERFYLIAAGKNVVHEAVIVRAQVHECGVKFVAAYSLAALREAGLEHVRRLTVERLPRSSTLD